MSETVTEPLVIELPAALRAVLADTPALSGALLVGGCVRDAVLGIAPEDYDVEVYDVDFDTLAAALAKLGATDVIGRAFGAVKLAMPGAGVVDFTIPRRDSKVSAGHRGFAVTPDATLTPREAAARRDFTLNALAWDPRRAVVIDHFGGLADLRARVLRHTSAAFDEDPLRVLRGMQFVARFELTVAPETLARCRAIAPGFAELARERVGAEWLKWATRAIAPSAGLRFLEACGWLAHFPELAALPGVEQDPQWHPEGDVWRHTQLCLDALVRTPAWLAADTDTRAAWSFAVLLHDTGKAPCTRRELRGERERVVSPGHERASGPLAASFLAALALGEPLTRRVVPLVEEHMAHLQCATDHAVRRLAHRLAPESIASLAVVIAADVAGRPPLSAQAPATLAHLLELAGRLSLAESGPQPLLLGRHLIERGWRAGPAFGPVLAAAFEAQLDGEFADLEGALAWLAGHESRFALERETPSGP